MQTCVRDLNDEFDTGDDVMTRRTGARGDVRFIRTVASCCIPRHASCSQQLKNSTPVAAPHAMNLQS